VLYVLDAVAETMTPIFDFQVGEGHFVLSAPFKNASRVLVSLYETDQVGAAPVAYPCQQFWFYTAPAAYGAHCALHSILHTCTSAVAAVSSSEGVRWH
jgi:hypothetical protein